MCLISLIFHKVFSLTEAHSWAWCGQCTSVLCWRTLFLSEVYPTNVNKKPDKFKQEGAHFTLILTLDISLRVHVSYCLDSYYVLEMHTSAIYPEVCFMCCYFQVVKHLCYPQNRDQSQSCSFLHFQHLDFSENILLNNLGHRTTFCVMKCKYFSESTISSFFQLGVNGLQEQIKTATKLTSWAKSDSVGSPQH